MTHAGAIIEDYFRRKGEPPAQALDAAYRYQMTVLRDMLSRLEVILDDEGVPRETAVRVIRCMLYGSPSPADAELRMEQTEDMAKMLATGTTALADLVEIFADPSLSSPPREQDT